MQGPRLSGPQARPVGSSRCGGDGSAAGALLDSLGGSRPQLDGCAGRRRILPVHLPRPVAPVFGFRCRLAHSDGERILATGNIPHSDPFSFLQTGHTWYAWEWLSDILMALFHRWQGLTGVVFLFTVCIGLAIWLCFRLHRSLGGDFFLACVMASPLVATAQMHWLARPHVLSYLFLLGTVFYFERAADRFRVRDGSLSISRRPGPGRS